MRTGRMVASVAVAAATAVCGAATAGALSVPRGGPTGNKQTIAYYTKVTANFLNKPANVQVYSGDLWLGYNDTGGWELSWDTDHKATSFQSPVDENELEVLSRHKVVWDEETFEAPCPASGVCVSTLTPLRFFSTKGGTWWAELNGPNGSASCWSASSGSSAWINKDWNDAGSQPWYVGNSPFSTSPHYDAEVKVGKDVDVTSTYKYLDGQPVSELDTISSATNLFVASSVHVDAHKTDKAFSWKATISYPKTAPHPPHIKACA